MDTGRLSRKMVAADGINVSAGARFIQNDPCQNAEDDDKQQRHGENVEQNALPQELEFRTQTRDSIALCHSERCAARRGLHRHRYDKRRQIKLRDDKSVDEADERAEQQRRKNRNRHCHTEVSHQVGGKNARKCHHRAGRKVSHAADKQQRHRKRDHRRIRGLPHHVQNI